MTSAERRYTVPVHVHYRSLRGEVVIMDSEYDRYLGLNHSAAAVWNSLAAGGTAEQAAEALVSQYSIDAKTASRDVAQLIEDLVSRGLMLPITKNL